MDLATLKDLLRRGLLGYQPFNFDNGVSLGTGLQLFGRPSEVLGASDSASFLKSPGELHNFTLGNIFIPPHLRGQLEYPLSNFYLPTSDADAKFLVQRNAQLSDLYGYFVEEALKILATNQVSIRNVTELGSNSCLFEFLFAARGIAGTGVDIVDYSKAVDFLGKELYGESKSKVRFRHLRGNSDEDIDDIPKSDLGWSYAVALHQANPLVHIAELSSISIAACFIMTTITKVEQAGGRGDLIMQFLSSNSYYQARFPQNFDVVLMSRELIKFSLKEVGFDKIIEIPFPKIDDYFETWAKNHVAYLAIRNTPSEVSIFDYPRSPERDGNRGDPRTPILCYAGKSQNIVLFENRYYVVAHGLAFPPNPLDLIPNFGSLNYAKKQLDEFK